MDLISRQKALDAFGLSEKTRKYGGDHSGYDTRMLYEIQDILEDLPSAEPEKKIKRHQTDFSDLEAEPEIIYCKNCKWWDRESEDSPMGYCHACKHGHYSRHWEIRIIRTYEEDFFCADAEPKEGEEE